MDKLTSLKIGVYARILNIDEKATLKVKRRLLELGFTHGQKVRVIRKSILGQTYLVQIRGYLLSMRKSLAEFLVVEK